MHDKRKGVRIRAKEVIPMVNHDTLTGILVGVAVGLAFTAQLAPHMTLIVVLAIVFGAKLINIK